MRSTRHMLLLLAVAMLGACNQPPSTLVTEGYSDKEMYAAITRARKEVDDFIKAFEAKDGEQFAVKIAIQGGGKTEHVWLNDLKIQDGTIEGKVANDPGLVEVTKFGKKVQTHKSRITDWMFVRDGKIVGNYTLRPLLKALPDEEEAERLRAMLP